VRGIKPRLVVDNGAISKALAAPSWLSVEAKKEWRRVVPVLIERRILTTGDLGSFENYCTAIGQIREMEAVLQSQGHVIEIDGTPKKKPCCLVFRLMP